MEAIEITSNQKMDKTRNKNTIWTIYYNVAKMRIWFLMDRSEKLVFWKTVLVYN